jgi:cytoskeletal protein CcmA (bactofilin family)
MKLAEFCDKSRVLTGVPYSLDPRRLGLFSSGSFTVLFCCHSNVRGGPMFGSKRSSSSASSEPTVIGKGTVIQGNIKVCGRVQVDGVIDGSLIAEGHVSVGPTGSVLGELVADELAVGGRVEGKVTIKDHLHVAPGGIARGEVRYGSLQVDRGGVIDGSTAHGEDADPGDASSIDDKASEPPPLTGRSVSAVS